MNETDLMHGRDWQGEDLAGWFVSDKFRGCRVRWDGGALWSRGGCRIAAPEWLLTGLPAGVALDGELIAGAGHSFKDERQAMRAVLHGRFGGSERVAVFDLVSAETFAARNAALAGMVWTKKVFLVPQSMALSTEAAWSWARRIQAGGGEGVIARRGDRPYIAGRVTTVLKLK